MRLWASLCIVSLGGVLGTGKTRSVVIGDASGWMATYQALFQALDSPLIPCIGYGFCASKVQSWNVAPGGLARGHLLLVILLCRLPTWSPDGQLSSLVRGGPAMRPHPALCQAGDSLPRGSHSMAPPFATGCTLQTWSLAVAWEVDGGKCALTSA